MPHEPERPEMEVEQTERLCECGERFDATVYIVGGLRTGPTLCPACQQAEDLAEAAYQGTTEDTRPVLEQMADVGINTRAHGQLPDGRPATLANLGPYGSAVQAWADRVLAAGRHAFVHSLYLEGPTGTGKSMLCAAAVRALLEAGYERPIVYDRARSLITTVQDRYGTGTVDPVLDVRRTAGVWILDDIGTEKRTPNAYQILEDIIDHRQGHATILASNLSRHDLDKRWMDTDTVGRLASRLGPATYRRILIEGQDRRFSQESAA